MQTGGDSYASGSTMGSKPRSLRDNASTARQSVLHRFCSFSRVARPLTAWRGRKRRTFLLRSKNARPPTLRAAEKRRKSFPLEKKVRLLCGCLRKSKRTPQPLPLLTPMSELSVDGLGPLGSLKTLENSPTGNTHSRGSGPRASQMFRQTPRDQEIWQRRRHRRFFKNSQGQENSQFRVSRRIRRQRTWGPPSSRRSKRLSQNSIVVCAVSTRLRSQRQWGARLFALISSRRDGNDTYTGAAPKKRLLGVKEEEARYQGAEENVQRLRKEKHEAFLKRFLRKLT